MNILHLLKYFLLFISINAKYSLYYSDHNRDELNSGFDCLYAHLLDYIDDENGPFMISYHLIPYCRRTDRNEEPPKSLNQSSQNIQNSIPFVDLYQQGITSQQLLDWSIPIDIVEQYEQYGPNSSEIVHNCSSSWFGSTCQYRFDYDQSLSFSHAVKYIFNDYDVIKIQGNDPLFTFSTCYPFLPSCYSGPSSVCLDWREICDGHVNCLNGEDEELCDDLEMNECDEDENEYRCHSGGQCIPSIFVRDGKMNIDCLDGSDEVTSKRTPKDPNDQYCMSTPTFQCEEVSSPRSLTPHCFTAIFIANKQDCLYYRNSQTLFNIVNSVDHIENETCRIAFFFIIGLQIISLRSPSRKLNHIDEPLNNYCSSEWILHPEHPIIFGYFQFVYSTNISLMNYEANHIPAFICFNASRCPGLLFCSVDIDFENGLNCCSTTNLIKSTGITWIDFDEIYHDVVQRCSTIGTEQNCSHPSLFHCSLSSKCISKHRLVDGYSDCYYGEDEFYPSCQLNDTSRFVCQTNPQKCLSIVAVGDEEKDCEDGEDEWNTYQKNLFHTNIPFGLFCDGEHDLSGTNISADTDESDCEWWPCNTPSFRCDHVWHCLNGEDELNCPDTKCSYNEHICADIMAGYQCIPIDNLIETYQNCNKTFFRRICLNEKMIDSSLNYFVWNQRKCLTSELICSQRLTSVNDNDDVCLIQPNIHPVYKTSADLINNRSSIICSFTEAPYFKRKPKRYLVTSRFSYLPSISNNISTNRNTQIDNSSKSYNVSANNWYCHRGILIQYQYTSTNLTTKCLCPPSYFGDRCQYQNQRISLTIQFIYRTFTYNISAFQIILMIMNEQGHITPYYEHIVYVPQRDCSTKFNLYLLYPDRPKNLSANYSIHIDIYDKITSQYWTSYLLSIPFQFLPVNRISTQIFIPALPQHEPCSLSCGEHGKCQRYTNRNLTSFCQCHQGYYGLKCDMKYNCSCSSDSICLYPSICLCPLNKFGRKCYLKHRYCQSTTTNPCRNNGTCIPNDDRIDTDNPYYCLCSQGFYGSKYQHTKNRIDIQIPNEILDETQAVLVHFISAFENTEHQHTTMFKRMLFNQNNITLYQTQPFHAVFIELFDKNKYYLSILRETFLESESIQTKLTSNQECVEVKSLLNDTYQSYPYLRRVKYYPWLCRQKKEVMCFYDEQYMCVCDLDRYSNCFTFDHNRTYDCQGYISCENDGECFQDNMTCPTTSICVCKDCFYGTKCQFSTKGFVLSLDYILGYHIKPNLTLSQQPLIIKMTIIITTIMLIIGLINGFISILTFRMKKTREAGCGFYLLISSCISVFIVIVLAIKFWLLILTQMNVLTNRRLLKVNCILLDMIINILLVFNDWLNVCVSVERVVTVKKGTRFDQLKSKQIVKWVVISLIVIIISSHIHDPLHRELIDDINEDEQRTWCLVQYTSSSINTYNKSITLFHFVMPFVINLISVISMIILIARYRSAVQPRSTFREHCKLEFKQHKHRIIATCALIILVLPRLVTSFMHGCMKSPRNSWLFLFSYLLSFLPSMLTFIIFILPSKTYKDEFLTLMNRTRRRIRSTFGRATE